LKDLRLDNSFPIRSGESQSRLQSLSGKITDLSGVIEEGDGIAVCF
jgi:hypothetical protein